MELMVMSSSFWYLVRISKHNRSRILWFLDKWLKMPVKVVAVVSEPPTIMKLNVERISSRDMFSKLMLFLINGVMKSGLFVFVSRRRLIRSFAYAMCRR